MAGSWVDRGKGEEARGVGWDLVVQGSHPQSLGA